MAHQGTYNNGYAKSDSSYDDEEEDGYVLVADDVHSKWDGDQTKYIPPTPYQSAVETAKTTWENLSWGGVKNALKSAAIEVANKSPAVIGSAAAEVANKGVALMTAATAQSPVRGLTSWQPPTNAFTVERSYGVERNVTLAQSDFRAQARARDHCRRKRIGNLENDGFEPQEMVVRDRADLKRAGPIFQEDEVYYDNLGVSNAWERPIENVAAAKRKKKLSEDWETRTERRIDDEAERQERIHMSETRSRKKKAPKQYYRYPQQPASDEDDDSCQDRGEVLQSRTSGRRPQQAAEDVTGPKVSLASIPSVRGRHREETKKY